MTEKRKAPFWMFIITVNSLLVLGVVSVALVLVRSDRAFVQRALQCHSDGMGTLRECFVLEGVEEWLPEKKDDDLPEQCPSARQLYGTGTPADMIECACYDVSNPPNVDTLYDWGMCD